jgi:exosortase H (IPTLxxWG-CTERM-specific)
MRRNRRSDAGPRTGARNAGGVWRFVLRFGLAALALFAAYWMEAAAGGFAPVNALHARVTAALLDRLGIQARAQATSIYLPQGVLDIVDECTGVYVVILFAAGVLAFPVGWRTKMLGLAAGVPCIVAINLVRLVSLGVVLRFRAAWLPWFHEYLWQVLFVGLVVIVYARWVTTSDRRHVLAP